MPTLKPWYKVVTPREHLREGRLMDASEFAVHLDHIHDGAAHPDYQDPLKFFEWTFLTRNLRSLSGEFWTPKVMGQNIGRSPFWSYPWWMV